MLLFFEQKNYKFPGDRNHMPLEMQSPKLASLWKALFPAWVSGAILASLVFGWGGQTKWGCQGSHPVL